MRSNLMKTRLLVLALVLSGVCFSIIGSGAAPVVSAERDSNGASLKMEPGLLRLEVFSPRIIRVIYRLSNALPAGKSLSVIKKPEKVRWKLTETADGFSIRTDEIEARV